MEFSIRKAVLGDIDQLLHIEQRAFTSDRLSRRSFQRWVQAEHGIFLVIESQGVIAGYGLVRCHKGTRLARMYSLAIDAAYRGQGLALRLMLALEADAAEAGRLFMRLEVAKHNATAIALYKRNGYHVFGEYSDYYEDHSDALRMQKKIQQGEANINRRPTPWYQQTTDFTCGPSSLMMAMASLNNEIELSQSLELSIWREATTIYMASGHGGCHPIGLAVAASKRGFSASVYLNSKQPLFVDGVRSNHKKEILEVVHNNFLDDAKREKVKIVYKDVSQKKILSWLKNDYAVLMMISTYRMDGKKVPHWVTVTSIDDRCLYVHDSDPDEKTQMAFDCQYLPIALADFEKMSTYGSSRLRTAVAIKLVNKS